jgi:hypothetical protein
MGIIRRKPSIDRETDRSRYTGPERWKERTTKEYRGLLAKRGFQLNKVVPTEAEFVIIEAIPA